MPNRFGKTLQRSFKNFSEKNILGYTFAPNDKPASLKEKEVTDMIKRVPREFADTRNETWRWNPKPSVYYTHGHVTLQHDYEENLGWTESDTWQWLFFGNLPEAVHQGGYSLHNRNDIRPGTIQFAEMARTKFGTYCWNDDGLRSRWSRKGVAAVHKDWTGNDNRPGTDTLLEIWIQKPLQDVFTPKVANAARSLLMRHPSRGHFYWVYEDDNMKRALHALVMEMVSRLRTAFTNKGWAIH